MNKVKILHKVVLIAIFLIVFNSTNSFASLTKEQTEDIANFAITFIEKGNERRDEKGYPLLVYALSNSWQECIKIRKSGYEESLYHIKNNNYHKRNGKYLDLGKKWCMDCGDYISYVYKTTLGFDMQFKNNGDPWHIKDIYADANLGENSKYFRFVYKNVPISQIDETKLEKGDIILRLGSRENHGLIYVGDNMQAAHASRNGIHYGKNPLVLGFEIVKFDRFYKKSTVVSIARVKDGIVDENKVINSIITWPDTGEKEDILKKENDKKIENLPIPEEEKRIELTDIKNIENIYELDNEINKTNFSQNIMDWLILELKRILIEISK